MLLLYMTEKTVTYIVSLLTEAVAAVSSASSFASGSCRGGKGCLGLEIGGSTSSM